jgi:predicted PurR-regulated permease PerM
MMQVLFGSSTGILSIITVVGAMLVVVFWVVYWYMKFGKDK